MTTIATSPDLDRRVRYRPAPGSPEAYCRLRVWHAERLALVTEVDDNPGMSVTNAIEQVGDAVEAVLGVRLAAHRGMAPGERLYQLVEHYAHRQPTLDAVRFAERDGHQRLRSPAWTHIRADEFEWLWTAVERG